MSELTEGMRPMLLLEEFRTRAVEAERTQNKEEIAFLNLNISTIYQALIKIANGRIDPKNGADLLLFVDSCYTQVLCHLMREGLVDLDRHCEELKEEVYKHSKVQNTTTKMFKEIDAVYKKYGIEPTVL